MIQFTYIKAAFNLAISTNHNSVVMLPNTFNFQVGGNLSFCLKANCIKALVHHNYTFANILMLTNFLVGMTVLSRY